MVFPARKLADQDTYAKEPRVERRRVLLVGSELESAIPLFSVHSTEVECCDSLLAASALAEPPELLVFDANLGLSAIAQLIEQYSVDSPSSYLLLADLASDPAEAVEASRAAFRAGADEYLLRPFNEFQLKDAIAYCFELVAKRCTTLEREHELRTVERHFHQLAGNIPQISWIADKPMGRTLYISPAYEKIFGLKKEGMIDDSYSFYKLIHPDDVEKLDKRWEGRPWTDYGPDEWNEVTYRIIRADGSIRWLWTRAFVIRDDQGEPHRLCGISEDITERKLLEEELVHTQKMRAIGELAGGIAHDFNNLLTPILGYSNLLREGRLSAERLPKVAEVIEKASLRAMDLTKRLLGFARRGKHQNISIDIHKTLHEILTLMSRTFDKNIGIEHEFYAPNPYVLGDPHQLHQVILNLVINARDALESVEKPQLSLRTEYKEVTGFSDFKTPGLEPGGYLVVSVSDNGAGIDEEIQPRIFEPFFTTKDRGHGSGMGLAMVYGIVKNHNGSVVVESTVGKGTSFHVYLPITEIIPEELADSVDSSIVSGSGTVLLVDDEDTVLEVARDMLAKLGYTVITASNGKEAVQYYQSNWQEIDLVVLDMLMPEMGGRDAFLALQKINPEVSAILSTGYDLNLAAQEILEQGVMGFIQKPYTLEQFSSVLADVLKASSQQQNAS